MALSPGERIGPYSVVRLLGTGGMGEVYLSRDERLRRQVALKRVSDAAVGTPDARRRLLREAQAAAQLNHPHIAAVHDVLEHGDEAYIVMEYVEGESLAERTRRSPLAPADLSKIALQLADALRSAHARGIVHRDLKPANVQLTPEGDVKVLDFGVAKMLPRLVSDEPTRTVDTTVDEAARIIGTPAYMSPEQLAGAPVDGRSDVYSLGVVLFELFTGRRPFEERDLWRLASAILNRPAPLARQIEPAVPAAMEALLARMLQKDPSLRPQTADAVREELLQIQRGRLGPGESTSTRRALDRRRWIAAATLASVLAAGALWLGTRRPPLSAPRPKAPAIIVLPLTTVAGGKAEQAIGEGIAKSVETALFDTPGLRVRTCTNPLECPSLQRDPIRIAREHGADLVVDGRVERAENSLRITLQLLDARSREIVWARQSAVPEQELVRAQDHLAKELGVHLQQRWSVPLDPDRIVRRVQLRSTKSVAALEKYSRAQILLTQSDSPENLPTAIALLERSITDDPSYALAHAALAQAYWSRYERSHNPAWADKARQACLNALAIDADQVEVRLALARYYSGTSEFGRALEQLKVAFSAQPDNEQAYRTRATVLADKGEYDPALADAERAIQLSSDYWRNHLVRGYVYYRANRLEEARENYRRGVELQPDAARGWLMLGAISLQLNDTRRALQELTRANEAYESGGAWSNIGTAHYWDGRYAEAAAAFDRAASLEPHDPVHQRNAGDAYLKLGQRQKAYKAYERAVEAARRLLDEVNANDPHRLAQLAVYEAKLGRYADARQHIAAAERVGDPGPEFLYRKAVVEAMAGDGTAAWRALQQALQKGLSSAVVCQDDDLSRLKAQPEFAQLCST